MSVSRRQVMARAGGAAAGSCVLLLAACTGSTGSAPATGARGAGLTVNWQTGTGTLDPAAACSSDDRSMIHNLYSTLLQFGQDKANDGIAKIDTSRYEPEVASSWKISDGGKTYTFTLKSGLKFPDGAPLDAPAVKKSMERTMKLGSCGAYLIQASNFDLIKSVQAPSATKLVIKVARPSADLLLALASPSASIVNTKQVQAHGGDKGKTPNQWLASHQAGAGPYILKSFAPNQKAVLTANPLYAGKAAKVKTVTVNYSNSAPPLVLQAKSGVADISLGLPLKDVADLKSDSCCRITNVVAPVQAQVSMQNKAAPFNNVKVREALALAVPYPQILKQVGHGFGSLFYGPLPPGTQGFSDKSTPITQNLTKAALQNPGCSCGLNPPDSRRLRAM